MALGQPFRQQFRAGDVIYGISRARAPYVNSLPPAVAHQLRSVGQFLMCDEFNNRTFGQVPYLDFGVGHYPDSKSRIKSNLAHHKETAAYLTPIQKAALQEYYDALKGTKYAPLKAVETEIAIAQTKGNQNLGDLVFRRACKFGLQFVIDQRKHTVHFALDVPAHLAVPGNRIDSCERRPMTDKIPE